MNSWKTLQEKRSRYEATCLNLNIKQDPLRHQVWKIDKLYKPRNMCIKNKNKNKNTCEIKSEKHTSSSYISNKAKFM